MNLARESIANARARMADRYAGETLREADALYKKSMESWKQQNKKFFVFRDYTDTRELAIKAYQLAANAGDEAINSREKIKGNAEKQLGQLRLQIERFEKYYKNLALSSPTLELFNKGKTRFLEAQIEFKKKEYRQALKLMVAASENLSQAEKNAHIRLVSFFEDFPKWQKNTELAFRLSKRGQTVILVDKMKASCIVLKSGKEHRTFPVEFGSGWMGDKNISGDKATPEGVYKVIDKKSKSRTKYYKALLLDYPNREDQKRYDQLVRDGKIPKGTDIGGLIEIHGEGGKGVHWTDGCIALENREMDVIYQVSNINTPVIIVGSRESLEDYLQ